MNHGGHGEHGEAVRGIEPVVIGPCTLYCGDCLEVLPRLSGVDAVITDPPYGIAHPCNFKARGRGALAECKDWPDVIGDDQPFDPLPWLRFPRVVLWGANYFADKLPASSGWLVWDKERPDDLDQSTCELAWSNCVKGVRRFRHLWNGMIKASERGESFHPTQKPVALMSWVLSLRWLADVRVILDPYMGGGSTAIAAIRAGKVFIGCEKQVEHFATACERIRRELQQGRLAL